MLAKLTILAMALASFAAQSQTTPWTDTPRQQDPVGTELILTQEGLRGLKITGQPVETKRRGNLVIEVRAAKDGAQDGDGNVGAITPANLIVRYRNRLVAAATGYRLGGEFTHNGVLVESWDGGEDCTYKSWRLEFAGERLALADARDLLVSDCRGG